MTRSAALLAGDDEVLGCGLTMGVGGLGTGRGAQRLPSLSLSWHFVEEYPALGLLTS